MKHSKRLTGFSRLKKKPSRRLRKTMENFIRNRGGLTRETAHDKVLDILWSLSGNVFCPRRGRQNKLRFGITASGHPNPKMRSHKYLVAMCFKGNYRVKKYTNWNV